MLDFTNCTQFTMFWCQTVKRQIFKYGIMHLRHVFNLVFNVFCTLLLVLWYGYGLVCFCLIYSCHCIFWFIFDISLGDRQEVDSVIYVWNEKLKLFQEQQKILTIGAYDWTYFYVEGYHFLAVAQAFNGISTLIDSSIYVFQNNKFYLFQTMEVSVINSMFLSFSNFISRNVGVSS